MALSAVGSLADSIDATRDFLFSPFRLRRWLALALVVFFAGGLGGFNPTSVGNARDTATQEPAPGDGPSPAEVVDQVETFVADHLFWVATLAVALVALALLFWLLGIAMQFVLVESLRTESVDVLGYLAENVGKTLHVAALDVVLIVASVLPWVAAGWIAWEPLLANEPLPWETLVALLVVGVLLAILASLVQSFTRTFVVPVMLTRDLGVLAGWRRFLGAVSGSVVEYLVYLVLAFVLRIALGMVVGIATAIVGAIVLVPLVLLGLVASAVTGFSIAAGVVIALLIVVGVLFLMVLGAVVQVPFVTYLQYYALFVLGDTDDDVDPIPRIRSRVREDSLPDADVNA